ncbi:MAG: 5-formyltetrahydrofolate cyclo-ligase, partial [Rhizobiaceae bacterium]|nr:5-formyltetrahydrofolate cyclo-ligase [Rhizobiaceae bacterium]
MTHEDDEDAPGSTVCLAHMLVDGHVVDPQTWKDVSTFRKSERKRLYAARQAQSTDERKSASTAISAQLDELLRDVAGRTIAAYWPIR